MLRGTKESTAATDAGHSGGGGTTTLPEDLLTEQVIRVQMLYGVGVLLWAIDALMDVYMAPQGDRGPYRFLIEAIAAVLAAAVVAFVHFSRCSHRIKIDLSVAFIVPQAFALALLNSWTEQPTTMRPVSGITVLILLFGMMAPARPGKMFVAALVSASMDPLGVWIAHLRGLPVPSVLNTLLMFYPNYACAVLTVAPARILYRLGRQLREARALGSYHLIERLGEGGMGEVWLARHRLLAHNAAIKLVRPEMLGSGRPDDAAVTLSRFEREARATAALTSPHTIRIFDFGVTDKGAFYYVMELLDGRDLESLVREFGPMPPARATYILRQICRSIAEAHGKGLIHRDIKPANIYVCRMGLEYDFVKVLDFGLVKQEDPTSAVTMIAESVAVGTPAYMAPEVIIGDGTIDRRLDMYAIGCVAYYLLTGELVFEAKTQMSLLLQHVQEQPLPPSMRTEQYIPRAVDDVVLAWLQKDPSLRPTAEELFDALEGMGRDEWDQKKARRWWEAHLPHLTGPSPASMPIKAGPRAQAPGPGMKREFSLV